MPLKPIYDKAPLKSAVCLPLRPGQVHTDLPVITDLLSLVQDAESKPVLWEGLFRAGVLTDAHGEKLPVAGWIEAALNGQAEDGSLPYTLTDSLAMMRAAFALYELTAARPLAEKIARWCGYLNDTWEQVLAEPAIRQHTADLMELLENMYRISGKKALLSLMEKLRRGGMDWAGVLHTFAVQRPTAKIVSWAELSAGMEAEQHNEEGFYTRQALICHSESLADGAQAAWMNGIYSGNGQELTACATGWERISRYHGAVCGGTTGDAMLEGTSPAAGVDAAALGAWCEALCTSSEENNTGMEATEQMLLNAIPHALLGNRLQPVQFVNMLEGASAKTGLYHYDTDADHVLARLLRGAASVVHHAVAARKEGLDLRLLMSGSYAVLIGKELIRVTVRRTSGKATVSFGLKAPLHTQVRVAVPTWCEDFDLSVNGEGADRGLAGKEMLLDRTWQNGDMLTITWSEAPRTLTGHHQGQYVMCGPRLMCLPASADTQWQLAMTAPATMDEDGQPCATFAPIAWKLRNGRPEELPVLPKVQGEARTLRLVPYAETEGIALFPKGTQA